MAYPVDIKTANITTATTTTVKSGATRILGLSWVVPTNVAVGTITVLDDSTTVWIVNTPATTSLVVTNAVVTHVTVYYG